jgi:hypothetical protein
MHTYWIRYTHITGKKTTLKKLSLFEFCQKLESLQDDEHVNRETIEVGTEYK